MKGKQRELGGRKRKIKEEECWDIQAIKHTQIYVVRQLAYSTELLVCINEAYKQYKQEEEKKLNSTQHSQALSFTSFSLCFRTLSLALHLSSSSV
jgi:hypothetical protein